MGKFNLIDEPWVKVFVNEKSQTGMVSLKELFDNAKNFKALAGDSYAQDFAVLRILLSVLHTVYSRYDTTDKPYNYMTLDDKSCVVKTHSDDMQMKRQYRKQLLNTWESLWEEKRFSEAVNDYLVQWHDHFYLFDDQFPFMQITKEELDSFPLSKAKPSSVSGKSINRLISESGNKIALFSPKYHSNKEFLNADEVARWLITYHGYTSLSDKVIFGSEKYKASKGWLFDIGGIYLSGENLFETLLLNLILVHPYEQFNYNIETPAWEFSGKEKIEHYLNKSDPDNLADLYTNWSRAVIIEPNYEPSKPFSLEIVKLPEINHKDNFLEPMTMWRFNRQGDAKGSFTPRKHVENEAIWRSFSLIAVPSKKEETHQPEIIRWLDNLYEIIDEIPVQLNGISMKDDGNATSWMPVDEVTNDLNIYSNVLTEIQEDGWVENISLAVEQTKYVVSKIYGDLLSDVLEIRNSSNKDFRNNKLEQMYFLIDLPFKNWVSSINGESEKAQKLREWRSKMRTIIEAEVYEFVKEAGPREYIGIMAENKQSKKKEIKNIATIMNKFYYRLNKALPKE